MKKVIKQAMSFDDIRDAVRGALGRIYGSNDDIWVRELFSDHAIYEYCPESGTPKLFKRSYSIVDGEVTLGEPAEVEETYIPKQSLNIMVSSCEGVSHVNRKLIDRTKGIRALVTPDGRIIQYEFPGAWSTKDAVAYIEKRDAEIICQAFLPCAVTQRDLNGLLPPERLSALKEVDAVPYFGSIRVKYGLGSNKQFFDEAFFQKAGAKFEGKPFLWNHSELVEFGNARPIGSIIKFLGAAPEGADFAYYLSASEEGLRQKFRESRALGNWGFIKKVSIEGIPARGDYTEKEGVKHFHDLTHPTGIAVVLMEGLKGSAITS